MKIPRSARATDRGAMRRGVAIALGSIAWLVAPGSALSSEALDLSDPTPRWVTVSFELSPHAEPGRLRAVFSPALPAWLEPAPTPGRMRLVVDGGVAERHLLPGKRPKPGSFSDFEWIFDTASGAVLSARLSGVLLQTMDLGITTAETETRFFVQLASDRAAGFKRARRLVGHELFGFCDDARSSRCTRVAGTRLDPETGWVNAVGEVTAYAGPFAVRAFCPLGEAIFREAPRPLEAVVARSDEAMLSLPAVGAAATPHGGSPAQRAVD